MDNIVNIDGTQYQTPIDALNDALEEMADGDFSHCNKVFIIALNDQDHAYDISYIRSDMSHVEAIALLETLKTSLIGEMGY